MIPGTRLEVRNCDCLEGMREMAESSVSAVVCDPPYGLSFMGKGWDTFGTTGGTGGRGKGASKAPSAMDAYEEGMRAAFAEALRVAAPGAHLLAFGGTRTWHRLACGIEDAGWELRDCLMWVYGTGMPKGLSVDAALRRSGHEEEAGRWAGWNTALKPAWEPIVLARKPLAGTVVSNVLAWGTGALDVESCRVPGRAEIPGSVSEGSRRAYHARPGHEYQRSEAGRWPANLAHDGSPEVVSLFPDSGGATQATDGPPSDKRGDGGSTARFFYCAKASGKERGEGNDHPTVKPVALMEWLVRMVTREGQIVLDPFCGSGSTGVACARLGRSFIGLEIDGHYCEVARARIAKELG